MFNLKNTSIFAALLLLTLSGCGSKNTVEGVYQGPWKLEFHGDKVDSFVMGQKIETTYTVSDGNIKFSIPGSGSTVTLKVKQGGDLDGGPALGTFKKI